jgi:hypothetical protein
MKTVCRVTTGQVHFLIIAFTYIHIQEPPGTIRSKIRKSVTFSDKVFCFRKNSFPLFWVPF